MAFDFKRRILSEKTHWVTTKGGHVIEVDDDGNVTKGIFTGANLKDKKSIAKKISKLSKIDEDIGEAKYMAVYKDGEMSTFEDSVAPYLKDEYTAEEFVDLIYDHLDDDDLTDSLARIFKNIEFEVVGDNSSTDVTLKCPDEGIKIVIQY